MFPFFVRKARLKAPLFAGLALALLTAVLVVSCPPDVYVINAQQPRITVQPANESWNVSSANNFSLSITAAVTDGGTLSYQWYKNTSNSTTGGTVIGTTNPLSLAKTDYAANGAYYFYVVVTNTIADNGDGGVKTATAKSAAATVTVSGNTSAPVTPVNAAAPTISAQPAGATWNVNTNPADLSSINPKVTASVSDGGTLSYQWYRNATNSTTGGTLISGQTGATLSLTAIRSAYVSADGSTASSNGTRYVYVVVTNTNNNATGNKTAATTSSAAAIVMQGIIPFGSAWPTGTHNAGTTNFTTIIQAIEGDYPSQYDKYYIRRWGSLSDAEKTSFGIAGTTQTKNGTPLQANDYIYTYESKSGVIKAINSFGGTGKDTWRGAVIVEFITEGTWEVPNNKFFGYYFGFFSQDNFSSVTNMGPTYGTMPSYSDTLASVTSVFTAANASNIAGSGIYGGGWKRQPDPWPTN